MVIKQACELLRKSKSLRMNLIGRSVEREGETTTGGMGTTDSERNIHVCIVYCIREDGNICAIVDR